VALGRTAAEHTARFAGSDCRFIELDGGHWLPEIRPEAVADAVLECAFRHADGPGAARCSPASGPLI
jgi:pimeloyl-ACP methyl ester carboxylesterase